MWGSGWGPRSGEGTGRWRTLPTGLGSSARPCGRRWPWCSRRSGPSRWWPWPRSPPPSPLRWPRCQGVACASVTWWAPCAPKKKDKEIQPVFKFRNVAASWELSSFFNVCGSLKSLKMKNVIGQRLKKSLKADKWPCYCLISNKKHRKTKTTGIKQKLIYSEITADSFSLTWSFKQRLKSLKV